MSECKQLYNKIKDKTNPDKSELLELLEQVNHVAPKYSKTNKRAIKLKLQARWLDDDETIMVKTMSQDQLYELENPLWLKNASLSEIKDKLYLEDGNNILNL